MFTTTNNLTVLCISHAIKSGNNSNYGLKVFIFWYSIHFNYLCDLFAFKKTVSFWVTPLPLRVKVVQSIMWSGTVPLTSVYGKSVSTSALQRPSNGSLIRRVNRDAGGSMTPWAPGYGSVTTRKWMFIFPSLAFTSQLTRSSTCMRETLCWIYSRWSEFLWRLRSAAEAAATGSRTNKPRPLDRCRRPALRGKMPPVQRTMSDLRSRSEGMWNIISQMYVSGNVCKTSLWLLGCFCREAGRCLSWSTVR